MKLSRDEKMYTLKEINQIFNVPIRTLLNLCLKYDYRPICYKGKYQYLLTYKQAQTITDYTLRRKEELPTIIYVTRTTEIYQSKLNFLELHQL
jgi:hypothetical protein